MQKNIGDLIEIEATDVFAPGIECIITEMSDGRITKAKVVHPDDRMATMGFIKEGDDYFIVEWEWSSN